MAALNGQMTTRQYSHHHPSHSIDPERTITFGGVTYNNPPSAIIFNPQEPIPFDPFAGKQSSDYDYPIPHATLAVANGGLESMLAVKSELDRLSATTNESGSNNGQGQGGFLPFLSNDQYWSLLGDFFLLLLICLSIVKET